jgi:hypothetical protein
VSNAALSWLPWRPLGRGSQSPAGAPTKRFIPQDVLDRVAPTALPRSSIIVSDEPLSRETKYRTEFVTVLNNQPQGGFVTRRPTVDVPVASDKGWGNDGFGLFFQRNWNLQPGNTRPRAGQYYQPMQQRWW